MSDATPTMLASATIDDDPLSDTALANEIHDHDDWGSATTTTPCRSDVIISNKASFPPSATGTRVLKSNYAWAMERGNERVGDGRRVGNCLDRGRVGVVDDDRGILTQAPKQPEYYSTCNQNAKQQSQITQ